MRLGRFTLLEPIGQGGMASVWRAVHREQGVEAAVKVLPARFHDEEGAAALRAEVLAMAQLDHPHIVRVYDHGEAHVDELPEGSPWVALEYVPGGTLADLFLELTWPLLRTTLLQLLSALAHAHARGVVHRDIKLANVLLSTDGVKLTDFGIAYAMQQHEDGGETPMHAGTPRYMAPEQIDARVHAQGPWTDLYALGVLAWRMATGTLPFPDDPERQAQAKRADRMFPFHPRFELPEGFPGWCARLMSANPRARFQNAADARESLSQLPRVLEEMPTGPTDIETSFPPPMPLIRPRATPAIFPRSWRSERWTRPVELLGCGLQLVGKRVVEIGRDAERNRLWNLLSTVHRTGEVRAVLLEGPSGTGKTALATWLGQRAEEVGAGVAVRTCFGDGHRGLVGLIARRLRCLGGDLHLTQARIDAHLGRIPGRHDDERARLLQMLLPQADEPDVGLDETFALVTRALRRWSRLRPVVVHLDDATPEAMSFVQSLFEGLSIPALVVLTLRTEARTPALDEARAHLMRAGAVQISLGPLPARDHRAFVQGLLHLDPQLAERVARRTSGNPLFAVQLLDDWVTRDALELSTAGFRLKNPMDNSLPADLGEVWRKRVDALLDDKARDRVPLELAAVLGHQVDRKEWEDVCRHAGWPPSDIAKALVEHHLAIVEPSGFSFIHGMLREAILLIAEKTGRLVWHHQAVADALRALRADPVRICKHLLAAEAGEAAIDPLELGASHAAARGDYVEALDLLRSRASLMHRVKVPPEDERWGRGWVAQAELYARTERWQAAESLARKAMSEGSFHDWGMVEVESVMLLVENRCTDSEEARELLDRAYQVAVQPGNESTLAAVCMLASDVARRSGDLEQAYKDAKLAVTHVLTHGGMRRARCELALAQTLYKLDRFDDAQRHLSRAVQLSERREHPFDRAACAYLQATLSRARGDTQIAIRHFREATDRFQALGDANAWSSRAHLGLLLAEQGHLEQASALFERVLDAPSPLGHLLAHLGSLLTGAEDVDAGRFATHLAAVDRYVDKGWSDPLAARVTALAATRADQGGFSARATRLRSLADRQRARLPA